MQYIMLDYFVSTYQQACTKMQQVWYTVYGMYGPNQPPPPRKFFDQILTHVMGRQQQQQLTHIQQQKVRQTRKHNYI